jgi:hypothetical protein
MDASPPCPELPFYLKMAVRFGTSPDRWPDALECYERAYGEIVAKEGKGKARRWSIVETIWLFIDGAANPFR